MRLLLILIISHCAFFQSIAQETLSLSLKEVVAIAQDKTPDVQLAKTRLATNYWNYKFFQAGLKPQIDLTASPFDLQRSISEFFSGTGQVTYLRRTTFNSEFNISVSQNIAATGANVFAGTGLSYLNNFKTDLNPADQSFFSRPIYIGFSQPLFGFNSLKWDKKTEPLKFTQATREYAEEMEQIAMAATNFFFEVYMSQINLHTAKINKSNADTLYTIAKGRFGVGRIAETDLLQIELSSKNADANLAGAEIESSRAEEQLRNFLGIKELVNFNLSAPNEIPDFFIDSNRALDQARRNRSKSVELELRLLEVERRIAQAKAQSGFTANVDGLIGLTQTGKTLESSLANPLDREEIGLRLTLPLADWGKAKARMEIAKSNKEFTVMDVEQERINFEREIMLNIQQFDLLKNQVALANRAYEIAETREDITRKRYRIGKIEVIDLNLALREKNEALQANLKALREYWMAYYNLRSLTLYDFENNLSLAKKENFERN